MMMYRLFVTNKLLSKKGLKNCFIKLNYSTRLISRQFEKLISRVDRSIDQSRNDDRNHEKIVEISNEFLENRYTLSENALFLSRILKYDKMDKEVVNKCLGKFNERIAHDVGRRVGFEKTLGEMETFSELAKLLISSGHVLVPFSKYFLKTVLSNIYIIIPDRIELFNSALEYLIYTGSREKLDVMVFELLVDSVWKIDPSELINTMYLMGKLDEKNEEVIRAFSRVLTNCVSKGLLKPHEKTKLAKAYSILNYEHITFFNHISKELLFVFRSMDVGNHVKNEVNRVNYVQGIGSVEGEPSGVMVEGVKYIKYYSNDAEEVMEEPKRVEFKGRNGQLYSCGQIMFILDAMIYLRLHHLERDFKNLVTYAIKHLFKPDVIEHFDAEQLRCSVSLLATCRKTIDDHLLDNITKRFLKEYIQGNATNSQLALFLKDLVKLTKIVVKRRSMRNKLLQVSTFVPPSWINNQLYENPDLTDPNSTRSALEHLCYKICDNFNSFSMDDLTSCLRSVAYLGFKNEKFYSLFIPFFRQNLSSLNNVAIANITQSFNRAGIKDKYFFYLLGKQHQLYLNDVEKKVYIKRIG